MFGKYGKEWDLVWMAAEKRWIPGKAEKGKELTGENRFDRVGEANLPRRTGRVSRPNEVSLVTSDLEASYASAPKFRRCFDRT